MNSIMKWNGDTVAYAEEGQGAMAPPMAAPEMGRGKKEMFAVKLAGKFWASEVDLYLYVYIGRLYPGLITLNIWEFIS